MVWELILVSNYTWILTHVGLIKQDRRNGQKIQVINFNKKKLQINYTTLSLRGSLVRTRSCARFLQQVPKIRMRGHRGNPLRLALRNVIIVERIKLLASVRGKVSSPFAYLIIEVGLESLEEHELIMKVVMKLLDDVHTSLVNICGTLLPHFFDELATALEVVNNIFFETFRLVVGKLLLGRQPCGDGLVPGSVELHIPLLEVTDAFPRQLQVLA